MSNTPTAGSDPSPTPHPKLECDIVMKGGITSGVVYPMAVVELSKTYRFCNVGGTSAGAIAAGATAAAELGRARKATGMAGFDRLAQLPKELGQTLETPLGKQSRLLSLFQPQASTRGIHAVMIAAMTSNNKLLGALWGCLRTYPLWALGGFLIGVALIELPTRPAAPLFSTVLALAMGVLGALVASLVKLVRQVGSELPNNGYGLCKGRELSFDSPPALSTYLADLFDQLAGQTGGKPVTFGDLAEHDIHLNVITTCISQGKSDRLPMIEDPRKPKKGESGEEELKRPKSRWNLFFFDPEELKTYLPERIVQHMVDKAPPSSKLEELGITHLKAMPAQADLPMVVAVRMSLSFPILLSAIPLYSIDYTRTDPKDRIPKRCWFSDGGLTSNFPVHFFDAPIPSRPTFALNLRPFHIDRTPSNQESQNVSSPMNSRQGREATWRYFERKPGFGSLFGFLGALFDATQNWSDNALLELPGYRERVAHVYLDSKEGGLNLVMEEEAIQKLSNRGQEAARLLIQKFAPQNQREAKRSVAFETVEPDQPEVDMAETVQPEAEKHSRGTITWDSHRFARLHSTMAALEVFLEQLGESYSDQAEDLNQLIEATTLTKQQKVFFKSELPKLVEMSQRWQEAKYSFWENAPKPEVEVRVRPRA